VTDVEVGGLAGRLVDRGLSWELRDLTGPPERAWLDEAARLAAQGGALDLRVGASAESGAWTALGFRPLDAGAAELVLPLTRLLEGVNQTRALGEQLAAFLRPGDLVVLSGPLGAGKTALTQGIAAGLGVRGAVTSPTFVLAREHRGPVPLVHVDAYRLRDTGSDALALADLDLEAALEDSVVVVEWGRGLVEGLADARLDVELAREEAGLDSRTAERRSFRAEAHGLRWAVVRPHSDAARKRGG
jgi:tRNA threonylcarbamoyladenosine biosynthesis protein TsaE